MRGILASVVGSREIENKYAYKIRPSRRLMYCISINEMYSFGEKTQQRVCLLALNVVTKWSRENLTMRLTFYLKKKVNRPTRTFFFL